MDLLSSVRLQNTRTLLLFTPLLLAISALPSSAQEAVTTPPPPAPAPAVATAPAAPAQPAAAPAQPAGAPAPAAEAAKDEAKPTPPDANKLITPEVIAKVKKLVEQPVTVISIGASNDGHAKIDQAGIDTLDKEWKTETKAEKQPLIAEMLSSPLSNYLLYLQAQSAGLYTEMFVMDNKGLNVGQSSVTSDYWQGDEAKYQKTFLIGPDATFIDEPEFDDGTKTWRVQFDFTIVDPETKQPIGAAAIEMNLTELERRQALSM